MTAGGQVYAIPSHGTCNHGVRFIRLAVRACGWALALALEVGASPEHTVLVECVRAYLAQSCAEIVAAR